METNFSGSIAHMLIILLSLLGCHEKKYHPNGALKSDEYHLPFSNIVTVCNYDTSGRLLEKFERVNGTLQGKHLEYYPDGRILRESQLDNGQFTGIDKEWYMDGALRVLGSLKNGERHGWRYSYDSITHSVSIMAYYEDGFKYFVQGIGQDKQPTGYPEFYLNVKYDKASYSVGDTIKCVVKFPLDTLTRFSPQFWYLWGQVKQGTVITQKIANDYAIGEYPIQKDSSQIKFLAGKAATVINYYSVVYLKNGSQYVCPVNESVTFSVPISD